MLCPNENEMKLHVADYRELATDHEMKMIKSAN
jgi:hypothetical protein